MGTITLQMTQAAYSAAKNVYHGRAEKNDVLDNLEKTFGMNRGSATDYINNFRHMMEGETYKRTFNGEATDYLLNSIYSDYGVKALEAALLSVKQHFTYYKTLGKGTLRGIENIYQKHQEFLQTNESNYFPDELGESEKLYEGVKHIITVNSYERSSKARKHCIEHYGSFCAVCSFEDRKSVV